MNKHILVTGGCGFIGSHFIEHILKLTDWDITVVDGLRHVGDANRLADIEGFHKHRRRLSLFWHDLRAPLPHNKIGAVDYVVNFASDSHVDRSIIAPAEFIHNNVMLTTNMLEWLRLYPFINQVKFIHISTDEVYGPAKAGRRFKEWDRHLPSNPYAASKSAQEALVCGYWRTYNLPVMVTCTMNNYGERQDLEKLVPKTINYLQQGLSVPIHAELKGKKWTAGSRTWLHARNHADALLFLLNNVTPSQFPKADRPTKFNIVGDVELNNEDMVKLIAKYAGVPARCHFVDFHQQRPGHDRRYALDGTKLAVAGWKAPLSFEESLEKTVKWTLNHK